MSIVDLEAKIPNNVGLRDNKRLMMALEKWQPKFLEWWSTLGPTTAAALRAKGVVPAAVAKRPDAESFAKAVAAGLRGRP
jgi:uroporphyrinogen-III synthase